MKPSAVSNQPSALPVPIDKLCDCCLASIVTAKCAWPIPQPRLVHTEDVRVGDVLVKPGRTPKRIVDLQNVDEALAATIGKQHIGKIMIIAVDRRKTGAGSRLYICRWLYQMLWVLRDGMCGNNCCDACQRDVGGRVYCRDHWHAWEAVN